MNPRQAWRLSPLKDITPRKWSFNSSSPTVKTQECAWITCSNLLLVKAGRHVFKVPGWRVSSADISQGPKNPYFHLEVCCVDCWVSMSFANTESSHSQTVRCFCQCSVTVLIWQPCYKQLFSTLITSNHYRLLLESITHLESLPRMCEMQNEATSSPIKYLDYMGLFEKLELAYHTIITNVPWACN